MSRLVFLRTIYSTVITLLLPLLFLRLFIKGSKSPDYRKRWAERLGFFSCPPDKQNGIWFHCVSVGETLAVVPLIKKVRQQHPNLAITITTTTPTGSARVKDSFGDEVFHVYLPFDTPGAIKRFFSKVKPKLLVIVETELWPNLIYQASRHGCKTLLANARLSVRSGNRYQQKLTTLSQGMMGDISFVAAHHQDDGERFKALGLQDNKLKVTGSIKFDINVDEQVKSQAGQLLSQLPNKRPVWVVGSTHEGEDEQVLAAFKQVLADIPDTLLILVPRHPERFESVYKQVTQLNLTCMRRTDNQPLSSNTEVLLGDTMGELMLFWACADVAFVGGSLVTRGGHNPLEPAAFSVPILSGPHVFNFTAIYDMLKQQGAVGFVDDSDSLAQQVLNLLQHRTIAEQQGEHGAKVVAQNRGAEDKLLTLITQLLTNQTDSHKKPENRQ